MPYLPNIIKKIDDFYRLASSFNKSAAGPVVKEYSPVPALSKKYEGYDPYAEAPENEDVESEESESENLLYNTIIESLEEFDDQDIANEVYVIAEEYKKATEIKAGFSKVLEDIKKAKNSLKDLLKEFGAYARREIALAEGFINDMEKAAQQMAASSPPPQPANEAAARQALNNAKKDAFGVIGRQEAGSQVSKFERGNKGELTSGTTGPKPTVSIRREKYESDIVFLNRALEDPTIPDNDKKNIPIIIALNEKILNQMDDLQRAKDQLSTIPEDIPAQQKVAEEQAALEDLRNQRERVQNLLREFNQTQKVQEWIAKSNATTNLKEKMWYELNAQLAQIRLIRKVNKTPAVEAAKELINELGELNSRGDFIYKNVPQERLDQLKSKFDDAKKQMITKAKYDRNITEQRGKEENRVVPTAAPQRGGAREMLFRKRDVDLNKETFPGMLKKLRDLNNTANADARKYIMRPKEKGDPTMEPFIEAISSAIRKKNKNAQYEAINKLKEKIQATLVASNSLKGYLQVLRLTPHFKRIEEALFALKEKQNEGGNWNLTDEDKQSLVTIISNIHRINDMYKKYYQTRGARKFNEQPYDFFKGAVTNLAVIKDYIVNNMLQGIDASKETETPAKFRVDAPEKQLRVENIPENEEALSESDELQQLINEQNVEQKRDKKFMVSSSLKPRMQIIANLVSEAGDPLKEKSKKQKDRELSEQRGKEQARESIPSYPAQRGGRRTRKHSLPYEQQPDLELASFKGLIYEFQTDFNTCFTYNKQLISVAKQKGDPKLKHFVDALAKAIVKKDNEAKYNAIKSLKQATAEYLQYNLKKVIRIARLMPHFRKLRDDLNLLLKSQDLVNNSWKINENNKLFVGDLLETITRLQKISQSYFSNDDHGLLSTLRVLARIKTYLEYVYTQGESS